MKFKFLNRRKIFYFFFCFRPAKKQMDIDSNGLKIQQRQFRGPCTNLAIEDIDGCAIRLANAISPRISLSIFIFVEIRHKKGLDKLGGFCASINGQMRKLLQLCIANLYFFSLYFFFLSYLQALNKHFTKNLETCNGINLYINLTMYNYLQLYSVFFLE